MKRKDWFGLAASVLAGLMLGQIAHADEILPPRPTHYVTDQAGILSASTIAALNEKLEAFERKTSDQVLVAIFPQVPDGFDLEDFTQRTFDAWGVGQKSNDNGVVLFIFPDSHKVRIQVGYGLEGALPDITAKQIITQEIAPSFRNGDADAGVLHGVDAILLATQNEYHGNGSTAADSAENSPTAWVFLAFFIIIAIIGGHLRRKNARRGRLLGPDGSRNVWFSTSGDSGGGSSGGDFSGGGGSSGGGGASGSW